MGTLLRLSTLRDTCLVRDQHRCVISRSFDPKEAQKRIKVSGDDDARDDDGQLLLNRKGATFRILTMANILPRSLVKANSDSKLLCFFFFFFRFL